MINIDVFNSLKKTFFAVAGAATSMAMQNAGKENAVACAALALSIPAFQLTRQILNQEGRLQDNLPSLAATYATLIGGTWLCHKLWGADALITGSSAFVASYGTYTVSALTLNENDTSQVSTSAMAASNLYTVISKEFFPKSIQSLAKPLSFLTAIIFANS